MVKLKQKKPPKGKVLKSKKVKQKLTKKPKVEESNYSSMSVDDFLDQDFDEASASEREENQDDSEINGDQQQMFEAEEDEVEGHKKSLERLKHTDPEFYSFLKENDKKLLKFDVSDEELDEDEENEEDKLHVPSGQLEIASDESDFEPEDGEKVEDKGAVTLKLLKKWQVDIQTDKTNQTIRNLVHAFHAALRRVSSNEDDDEPVQFKVGGSAVFNGIIQLCVLELCPAVKRFLGIQSGSKQPPHKCKRFVKVKNLLKLYFTDLLKLLGGVTSSNILSVLLKHLHYMTSLLVSFRNITKPLLKRLIELWSTSEETVRVVSFLCILRITNFEQAHLLDTVLKMMYMGYVRNTKFVNVNVLPGINFMRRSLVEMFMIDTNISYQHVFLYIRQLAIHLRTAITMKKKENIQAVYNWQFVNSLRLWGNLLGVAGNKPQLQPLVYPFVQVCLGTVKLIPTAQYFPLRFHIVQILMDLSRDTGIFIPVLPFLIEVLTAYDFNKKHQKLSMKPIQFTCLLRLSKSQLSENSFKDVTIDTVYGHLLEYLSTQSHSIAFPDLSLFCIVQLKHFIKKCKNANYTRKMKQLVEKIQQNSQFIENERKKVTFNLSELKQIEGWEAQIKNKGTPMSTFFESWNKMRVIKKSKEATNNESVGDYNLPALKKVAKGVKEKKEGPVELFPSDSESDGEEKVVKRKRGKRGGKNAKKKVVDESGPVDAGDEKDIVQDLKLSDW